MRPMVRQRMIAIPLRPLFDPNTQVLRQAAIILKAAVQPLEIRSVAARTNKPEKRPSLGLLQIFLLTLKRVKFDFMI